MSPEQTDALIALQSVDKRYCLSASPTAHLLRQFDYFKRRIQCRSVQALSDVSFRVDRGETVGIVGRNGSGKSTLLQLVCGTVPATAGTVTVNGRIAALLELGAGFNPEFSGRENVFLNAALLGLSREQLAASFDDIVAFSEIGDSLHRPVKTYSSGMFVRLAFSVAAHCSPDILIVDEALAVGDEAFQRKCYARIREMQERGATILFVTHSAATVVDVADRAILLDKGRLLMDDKPKKVIAEYHRMLNKSRARQPKAAPDQPRPQPPALLAQTDEPFDEAVDEDWFDPHLAPKSMLSYPTDGAEIRAVRLLDAQDRRVNVFTAGGTYRLAYRVRFSKEARNVRFGMLIKTVTGYELGGVSSGLLETAVDQVAAGTELDVEFAIPVRLNADVYFMNVGVSGTIDGEEVFLHRIVDALMFRVIREHESLARGVVDFGIQAQVRPVRD